MTLPIKRLILISLIILTFIGILFYTSNIITSRAYIKIIPNMSENHIGMLKQAFTKYHNASGISIPTRAYKVEKSDGGIYSLYVSDEYVASVLGALCFYTKDNSEIPARGRFHTLADEFTFEDLIFKYLIDDVINRANYRQSNSSQESIRFLGYSEKALEYYIEKAITDNLDGVTDVVVTIGFDEKTEEFLFTATIIFNIMPDSRNQDSIRTLFVQTFRGAIEWDSIETNDNSDYLMSISGKFEWQS